MQKLNEDIKQKFLNEFGKNVRKIRKCQKLTQVELALRINRDDKKISRIERGLYDIKLTSLLIIAKALQVSVSELINLKNINLLQEHIWE
jgi:transcriptional regulator with XRE-family HTH domain